jgi:hypothetical protein
VRELGGDVSAAQHEQPLRQVVEAHHRVAGVEADLGQTLDGRDHRARPGGDHDLVRGDGLPGAGVQGVYVDEPRVSLEEGDVAVRQPPLAPAGRDRVDAAEDAVADLGPAGSMEGGVHAQPRPVPGRLGEVGGVDEHLGGDAADVEAGAAEGALLEEGDAPVGEALVHDRVPRAGADDREVEVRAHRVIVPGCDAANRPRRCCPSAGTSEPARLRSGTL